MIYTDDSWEFGKVCEDLRWNHCTSTPHRSETKGIAESSAESDVISVDTDVTWEGIPALNWWSIVIDVLEGPRTTHWRKISHSRRRTTERAALIWFIQTLTSPANEHLLSLLKTTMRWSRLFDQISLNPGFQIHYVNTSTQTADILTKGSFNREMWTQWIQLFNIMDQCPCPSATRRGYAQRRKVATSTKPLCLFTSLRRTLRWHWPGRDPEREQSVATRYEESEDPTLLHQPHDGANEIPKSEILQNISLKFNKPRAMLDRFLLIINLCGEYPRVRVCGQQCTLAETKTKLRRIIQILKVQKIQTVFQTVQVQIGNLKLWALKLIAHLRMWIGQMATGANNRCSMHEFLNKVKSVRILWLSSVSWWKMRRSSGCSKKWENDRIDYFVESREYRQLHDIAGRACGVLLNNSRGMNHIATSKLHTCRTQRTAVSVQRQDNLHVNVLRREWVAESKWRRMETEFDTGVVVC